MRTLCNGNSLPKKWLHNVLSSAKTNCSWSVCPTGQGEGKLFFFANFYLHFPWFLGFLGKDKNVTRDSLSLSDTLYFTMTHMPTTVGVKELHSSLFKASGSMG